MHVPEELGETPSFCSGFDVSRLSVPRLPADPQPAKLAQLASSQGFERLSHQISLASKHWAAASRAATTGASGASEEVLQMKDGFELGGFRQGDDLGWGGWGGRVGWFVLANI